MFANRLDFFLDHEDLITEAERTLALESIVRQCLPQGLGRFCSAGRLIQGRLTLYAANGSVALKLRQMSASLLDRLKARGCQVDSLKISVRVNPEVERAKTAKPGMGRKGLESFRELADALPDSPLKSSVESLLGKLGD